LRLELRNKVDITLVCPTSIPETNFRKNSLAPPTGEIFGEVANPNDIVNYVMLAADRRVV